MKSYKKYFATTWLVIVISTLLSVICIGIYNMYKFSPVAREGFQVLALITSTVFSVFLTMWAIETLTNDKK